MSGIIEVFFAIISILSVSTAVGVSTAYREKWKLNKNWGEFFSPLFAQQKINYKNK